jgi:carbonic anhydrase
VSGERPVSVIDALLFHGSRNPPSVLDNRPSLRLAVVACMDARLDLFSILGLGTGQVHVIRNAGGLVDQAAVRSLAISQRKLGTREILIIQHTGCGLHGLDDDEFAEEIACETGRRPAWSAGGFPDLEESVRAQIRNARAAVEIPHRDVVRGAIVDLDGGGVHEVVEGSPPA